MDAGGGGQCASERVTDVNGRNINICGWLWKRSPSWPNSILPFVGDQRWHNTLGGGFTLIKGHGVKVREFRRISILVLSWCSCLLRGTCRGCRCFLLSPTRLLRHWGRWGWWEWIYRSICHVRTRAAATRWVNDSLLDDEGGCVFECGHHYIVSWFKNKIYFKTLTFEANWQRGGSDWVWYSLGP